MAIGSVKDSGGCCRRMEKSVREEFDTKFVEIEDMKRSKKNEWMQYVDNLKNHRTKRWRDSCWNYTPSTTLPQITIHLAVQPSCRLHLHICIRWPTGAVVWHHLPVPLGYTSLHTAREGFPCADLEVKLTRIRHTLAPHPLLISMQSAHSALNT